MRRTEAAQSFHRAWNRHFHAKKEITVERALVWAYKEQKVIEITGRAGYAGETLKGERYVSIRNVSGDGCIAVERNSQLGCAIDGGGPIRGVPQPLHADAEAIHEAVLALPWAQSGILVAYGRSGTAPELSRDPRLVRVPEFVGRPGRDRWRAKVTSRHDFFAKTTVSWCPVVVDYDGVQAMQAIEVRRAWFDALSALSERLECLELQDHEVIGVGAPRDV